MTLFCETALELARLDQRLAEIAKALPRPHDLTALAHEPAEGQLFSLIAGFRGVLRNTVFQLLELGHSHRLERQGKDVN